MKIQNLPKIGQIVTAQELDKDGKPIGKPTSVKVIGISSENGKHTINFESGFIELSDKDEDADARGWWKLTSTLPLNDADRQHIANAIQEGYTEGEVVHQAN